MIVTASVPMVRSTASRPSVITAIENSGSPIIGRMISRSMTRPRSTARAMATTSDENHIDVARCRRASGRGSPSRRAACEKNQAVTRAIAPWAKLTALRRLEHEHEAEGDEGVDRALGEAPGRACDEAFERVATTRRVSLGDDRRHSGDAGSQSAAAALSRRRDRAPRRTAHHQYIDSMRSPNVLPIASRLIFWVAVSSPSS